uniref:Uncharacterized protein n=1 Tax=Aegilops tauschii subsp. strangulata TaxID=200361 RepID=A0A453IGR1_AEGTS
AAASLLGRSSDVEVGVCATLRTESTDPCWSWSTTTTPSIRPPPLQQAGASHWLRMNLSDEVDLEDHVSRQDKISATNVS